MDHQIHPELKRLYWRARRGLLENDLLLARFFQRYEHTLTDNEIKALNELLELADYDLLDVLLLRKNIQGRFDVQSMAEILAKFRSIFNSTLS